MKITFVDAGVLIAAARGGTEQAERALAILDDPEREFAASVFLRLEVLPQAMFHKRSVEVAFYDAFFDAVRHWATDLEAITTAALREAAEYGVEAVDALHVASAALVGAAELVTVEKPSRAIHRARSVRVVTIHPVGT
jgi:predicted nucleic acid-binding protein